MIALLLLLSERKLFEGGDDDESPQGVSTVYFKVYMISKIFRKTLCTIQKEVNSSQIYFNDCSKFQCAITIILLFNFNIFFKICC